MPTLPFFHSKSNKASKDGLPKDSPANASSSSLQAKRDQQQDQFLHNSQQLGNPQFQQQQQPPQYAQQPAQSQRAPAQGVNRQQSISQNAQQQQQQQQQQPQIYNPPPGPPPQEPSAAESQHSLVDNQSAYTATSQGQGQGQGQQQQHQVQNYSQPIQPDIVVDNTINNNRPLSSPGPPPPPPAGSLQQPQRKPVIVKEPREHSTIGGIFHRKDRDSTQPDSSYSPSLSSSIGRKLSTRGKSHPAPPPPHSPSLAQQPEDKVVKDFAQQLQNQQSKQVQQQQQTQSRPQSLLPPPSRGEEDQQQQQYTSPQRPDSIAQRVPTQPQYTPYSQNNQSQAQSLNFVDEQSSQEYTGPVQSAVQPRTSVEYSNDNGLLAPAVAQGSPVSQHSTMPPANNGTTAPPAGNPPGYNAAAPAVGGDGGRATPTTKGGEGMNPSQVQALITDFDILQGKYRKVKNLYFDRNAEIERLQNTLAQQRIYSSRTSLDDGEYSSRFDRLDGAIKNIAFEIRQNWKVIPGWLQPVINASAEVKGGREMTIVGRAAISRWVVDEILDRFFHPCLEPTLSANLKSIEHNIRRNSPQPQSTEEDDALSAKVCAWRMSTVDGTNTMLNSQLGHENRAKLTAHLADKLITSLSMHLQEPAPPGLAGGVGMIIELAVGLASNIPLESRDVRVWYPLPGEKYDTVFMKGESGLPPLTTSIETAETVDSKTDKDAPPPISKDVETESKSDVQTSGSVRGKATSAADLPSKKPSMLKNFKGKLQGAGGPAPVAENSLAGQSQASLTESVGQHSGPPPGSKQETAVAGGPPIAAPVVAGQEKVRVAGFMAVEVRGKAILIKAPVWL